MLNGLLAWGENHEMELVVIWIFLSAGPLALYTEILVNSPGIFGMPAVPVWEGTGGGCQFGGQVRWRKEKPPPYKYPFLRGPASNHPNGKGDKKSSVSHRDPSNSF